MENPVPDTSPILEEPFAGSRRLYLIFGGRAGKIGMPVFEFYKASQILNENRIFVRDLNQSWYQNGLPGISTNIDETVDFLRGKIASYSVEQVYFVGNSMGGFAAYLFASLLGMGRVIAFAPQTFISPWKRFWARDRRWDAQIQRVYQDTRGRKRYFDLARLPRDKAPEVCDIFVCSTERLDLLHARYISRRPGVTLHLHEIGGHALVRHLRDSGELASILTAGSTTAPSPKEI